LEGCCCCRRLCGLLWRRRLLPLRAAVALGYVALPCAAVDLGVEALVMSPDFVSEQGFSPASSSSDLSLAVFSQRRLFGGRQRRRNKVLQTSLSFVGVCSGAGVGSVSSYIGVVVACWSSCFRCLSRVEPQGYCDVPVVYGVFR